MACRNRGLYPVELRCGRDHPTIAIDNVFEANALDQVAQLALGRLAVVSGEMPIVGCARQAREAAQVLYVGMRVGCLRGRGFDDFDDADAGLPCAAVRSNARKAFRKKIDVHLLAAHQPFKLGDAGALDCASAERLLSYVARGLSLRGLGLGRVYGSIPPAHGPSTP